MDLRVMSPEVSAVRRFVTVLGMTKISVRLLTAMLRQLSICIPMVPGLIQTKCSSARHNQWTTA